MKKLFVVIIALACWPFALQANIINVNPGTGTIATALATASAGDLVQLKPGTFVENAGIVIPNNVHLRGSGRGVSIITSTHISPENQGGNGLGFIAPGDNSVISDLSAIGGPSGPTDDPHCIPIYRCCSATKTWTNVTFINCHLYGPSDTIIMLTHVGDMKFINCLLGSKNDIVSWQTDATLELYNCVLKGTFNQDVLSGIGLYCGNSSGTVKAYDIQIIYSGLQSGNSIYPLASDGRLEVHNCVIDYRGQTPGTSSKDINVWTAGTMFLDHVTKADGLSLTYDGTASGESTLMAFPTSDPHVNGAGYWNGSVFTKSNG